jgi:hypothetical protein
MVLSLCNDGAAVSLGAVRLTEDSKNIFHNHSSGV